MTTPEELLQHRDWLTKLAFSILGDYALAEDVSQEVLLAALTEARSTRPILRAWLAAVATNHAKKQLRSLIRRRRREGLVARPEAVAPQPFSMECAQLQERLVEAVEALPAMERQLVRLRFQEEQSFRSLAATFGISEGNARVRLHRALARLRASLSRSGHDWSELCGSALVAAPILLASREDQVVSARRQGKPWAVGIAAASLLAAAFLFLDVGAAGTPALAPASMALSGQPAPSKMATLSELPQRQQASFALPISTSPSASLQADLRPSQGLLLMAGRPQAGVEVHLYQPGNHVVTTTDSRGVFHGNLNPDKGTFLSATSPQGAISIEVRDWPIQVELWPFEDFSKQILVEDEDTGAPIPGATVHIHKGWSPFLSAMVPLEAYSYLLAEGQTDAAGHFAIPQEGWLQQLQIFVEAEGYLSAFEPYEPSGPFGKIEIELQAGSFPRIRVVDQTGAPVVGAAVTFARQPYAELLTDAAGFLPPGLDQEASLWSGTMESGLNNTSIRLPSGREFCPHSAFENGLLQEEGEGWRLTVDDSPILASLQGGPLPTGHWIEAVAKPLVVGESPSGSGRLTRLLERGEDRLDGLGVALVADGAAVPLPLGGIGPGTEVLAILMPERRLIRSLPVVDGRVSFAVELTELSLSVPGLPANEEFEVSFRHGFPWGGQWDGRLDLVQGQVTAVVPSGHYSVMVLSKTTGVLAPMRRGQDSLLTQIATIELSAGEQQVSLQADRYPLQDILVEVGGKPVIGGSLGWWNGIDASGHGLGEVHEGMLSVVGSFGAQAAWSVQEQSGGPIAATRHSLVRIAYPLIDRGGQMVLELPLAKVRLALPAGVSTRYAALSGDLMDQGTGERTASITASRSRPLWGGWLPWDRRSDIDRDGAEAIFRIPAGRYRFFLSGVGVDGSYWNRYYGGAEGVRLEADTLTILQPED